MRALPGRIERRGVEILVEKGAPLVSEAIKTTGNAFSKSILNKHGQPVARVVSGRHVELIEGLRRHIALVTHHFQDVFILGPHPIGAFPCHATASNCGTHRYTGTYRFGGELLEPTATCTDFYVEFTENYFNIPE